MKSKQKVDGEAESSDKKKTSLPSTQVGWTVGGAFKIIKNRSTN